MREIVGSDRDPLSEVVGWIFDEKLDVHLRLSAASVAIPFLYPKLSSSQVSANHIVTQIGGTALLDRIAERIEQLVTAQDRDYGHRARARKATVADGA